MYGITQNQLCQTGQKKKLYPAQKHVYVKTQLGHDEKTGQETRTIHLFRAQFKRAVYYLNNL